MNMERQDFSRFEKFNAKSLLAECLSLRIFSSLPPLLSSVCIVKSEELKQEKNTVARSRSGTTLLLDVDEDLDSITVDSAKEIPLDQGLEEAACEISVTNSIVKEKVELQNYGEVSSVALAWLGQKLSQVQADYAREEQPDTMDRIKKEIDVLRVQLLYEICAQESISYRVQSLFQESLRQKANEVLRASLVLPFSYAMV